MSEPPLHVLCYGDSLTYGFWSFGFQQSPYADRLRERLRAAFPERDIFVTVKAYPGCMASVGSFNEKLEDAYEAQPDGYDWVIILGGTNDLAYGVTAQFILSGLERAWQCAFDHGARVLALTVPETRAKSDQLLATRDEVNELIMEYKTDAFYPFDLRKAIPYHGLSETEQEKYWDDGVHLTGAGYEWMGNHIADELIDLVRKDV